MQNDRLQRFLKTFGPGIMFAGTCIGGSHLIQSTRAGAEYGFSLLLFVLLANLFKYPFFEFASRYSNATGDSVLEGYYNVGKWVLVINGIITFFSMFVVTAAIGFVTGGLVSNLFGADPNTVNYWIGGVFLIVFGLLSFEKFSLLDNSLKVIGVVLVISVVTAVVMVVVNGRPEPVVGFEGNEIYSELGYGFLIALMGWMPMGVDMSSWHSLWTQERIKQTGYHPSLKETLLDFNIGYAITVFLAVCFLTLGAYVMYGTGIELSSKATVFSHQLVTMFSGAIGSWSYFIIAIAAFSTMFGTSLTLVDGYCRSINRTVNLLVEVKDEKSRKRNYLLWMVVLLFGAFMVIYLGTSYKTIQGKPLLSFKILIDIATATSFLIAPFAAVLNFKILFNKEVPDSHKPNRILKVLAVLGLLFLLGFSLFFIYLKV